MGTAKEWVQVFWQGAFWGGLMACWEAYRRHSGKLKPTWRAVDLAGWALMGAWVGVGSTFGWRAFHRPLVFFMAAPLVVILVLCVRRWRIRRKMHEVV
jgi:hypothetical protein